MRREGFSVVLFDEVEKAHPDVLNVLLQILDEGQVTDGQGTKVDFKNTIIIMTSNIGAEHVLRGVAQHVDVEPLVMDLVRRHFRPELLNRIGEIIMFHPLDHKGLRGIISRILALINERLAGKQIEVRASHDAMDFLVDEGYSPEYGARPLNRYVEKHVVTHLSKMLLRGQLMPNSTVWIDCVDDDNDNDGGSGSGGGVGTDGNATPRDHTKAYKATDQDMDGDGEGQYTMVDVGDKANMTSPNLTRADRTRSRKRRLAYTVIDDGNHRDCKRVAVA